jgi:hypothetical protein
MSHAGKADKLLIKPAAGARPTPPHTRGQITPKAHTKRPATRRVTRGTATTKLAMAPDRPTKRVSQSPERLAQSESCCLKTDASKGVCG